MSALVVSVPDTYLAERSYILTVLLKEFLGLDFRRSVHPAESREVVLFFQENPQRRLVLTDVLFQTPSTEWLTESSMPVLPLLHWHLREEPLQVNLENPRVPVLYGKPLDDGRFFHSTPETMRVGLDIFGSCFWLLTRYEECVLCQRDAHARFPDHATLTVRLGLAHRPLVNEYVEILWGLLQRLSHRVERKRLGYRLIPTHDVDWPFVGYGVPANLVLYAAIGDLLKRRAPALALRRLSSWLLGTPQNDPANTFDFIWEQSERRGLQSEFYFITDHTAGWVDGVYEIHHPLIQRLVKQVAERGHVVGLHPSYHAYRNPQQIAREFAILRQVAENLKIHQSRWGGRQHYLRWENPTTWQAWEDAGLDYDSTVGFATIGGFRCGTCYEYPVFNLQTRQALQLRERPLIAMEISLTERSRLSDTQVLEQLARLSNQCRRYGGQMVLLWHNSYLMTAHQQRLYQQALEAMV